jgi:hypothetical protein
MEETSEVANVEEQKSDESPKWGWGRPDRGCQKQESDVVIDEDEKKQLLSSKIGSLLFRDRLQTGVVSSEPN